MAAPQATIRVTGKAGGKTYDSLTAWLDHIAKEDLPLVLPTLAGAVLREQKQAGNPPSNILVDGRAAREADIAGAKKRVQLFFLDAALLARAVALAFDELRRLYTRQTGRAAGTIQIWGRVAQGAMIRHERIANIGAVREWLERNRSPSTYVRLIGPDVPFRRSLYYAPPGSKLKFRSISRVSKKRLAELEAAGGRARIVEQRGRRRIEVESAQTVSEIVVRRLTGVFGRSIYVSARWIEVPVPPWKGVQKARQGVPAIAVGWRLRGALG